MSEASVPIDTKLDAPLKRKATLSTLSRVLRYTAVRVVILFFTVVASVYLTILIANMGGYVDKIQRGQIQEAVGQQFALNPAYKSLSAEERQIMMAEQIAIQEKRLGLNKPFLVRRFTYLGNALTLDLGRALQMASDSGSKLVKNIILERLPATLLLFGTADVFLFILAILIALSLSSKYGSFFDKLCIALAPVNSAPGWFYGIFLILIFAALLHWLPFGGLVDAPPPASKLLYTLSLLKHMVLPLAAITLSRIFYSSYNWRTFFLIYSSEDYVDMAKAKGLTSRSIERQYILRPTLPTIITNFALLVMGAWPGP